MGSDSIGQVDENGAICECAEQCRLDCKGECGCPYCKNAYQDFLSSE